MKSLLRRVGVTNERRHIREKKLCNAARRLESILGKFVDCIAAFSVAIEIIILLAGVIARYSFHRPLVWGDELASIIFLWLTMFGAVVAFRLGRHMRMTAILAACQPRTKRLLNRMSDWAVLLFLSAIIWPSCKYVFVESFISTPALQISNSWRAAVLPIGIGLMMIFAILRLVQQARRKEWILAPLIIFAALAICWGSQTALRTLGNFHLLIFFVSVLLLLILSGVPIAFAFGLSIASYLVLATDAPQMVIVNRMDEGMGQLILLAVPLFIFLGLLLEMTGMARALVAFLVSLLGHVRGGMHYAIIGAMYIVSGISGSKAADMAAIASVLFPEMKKRGENSGDLVALLAATGAQTETIPPSLVLITIGSVTGVSITALFLAGFLPGLVSAVMLAGVVWYRFRKEDLGHLQKASFRQILRKLIIALPALALPLVIRTAVTEGMATATEVSTIGIVFTIFAGLIIYRQFDWRRIVPMLIETASLSGSILLIIGMATAMSWGLTVSGLPSSLTAAFMAVPQSPALFIAASIVVFLIFGSVLEGIPAIVLLGPLLFPVATTLGVDGVHYAMIAVLSMGIGLFAPPLGVGYYIACATAQVDPALGVRPLAGYLLSVLVGLIIVAAFPWISVAFL